MRLIPGLTRLTRLGSIAALLALVAGAALFEAARAAAPVPLYGWQNMSTGAAYAGRDGAGVVYYANKLWLLGGWNAQTSVFPYTTTNEVWNSSDGVHWKLVKPNTFKPGTFNATQDWEGRHMAGWVVYQNKLWVVGGDANQCHYQPNVWNSSDGVHWTEVANNVPWGNRVLHYTVVFDNMIWVMGGQTMTLDDCIADGTEPVETAFNDVWNSSDGVNWTKVTNAAPWGPRGVICGAVVFNGRIWVIGGGTYGPDQVLYQDVWSTADGVNWTQATASAPWQGRIYHDVAVFGGRMWLLAGHAANGGNNLGDVWSSTDGANWVRVPTASPWLSRHAASVFVLNNGLWMTGGTTDENGSQNDIWKLDPGAPIVPIVNSLLLK